MCLMIEFTPANLLHSTPYPDGDHDARYDGRGDSGQAPIAPKLRRDGNDQQIGVRMMAASLAQIDHRQQKNGMRRA